MQPCSGEVLGARGCRIFREGRKLDLPCTTDISHQVTQGRGGCPGLVRYSQASLNSEKPVVVVLLVVMTSYISRLGQMCPMVSVVLPQTHKTEQDRTYHCALSLAPVAHACIPS
jgi:hypothetical protein